jgi:HemY protein
MIRVILFLALVGIAALGVAWIADRPGDVAVTWLGFRIETSVTVAAVALAVTVAVAVAIWSLLRTVLRTPDYIAMFLSRRRGERGYRAISRGLVAIGAGDTRAASRAATEARRLVSGEPLALLLDAQCAQLGGDQTAAEQAFRAMAERADTKLLGLRGLFIEAQRRHDAAAALSYAEAAVNAAPALGWANKAILEFHCTTRDWAGALTALERSRRHALVDKADYQRKRAVLLTAQALAAEETDRDAARALAQDALRLAPTLVPAAELAGRLLGEAGELRRAIRVIEKAWEANPHPDLADTYAHLRPGDSARERLARVQTLAQKAPGHIESALAVAQAALDAQEFATAREALKPLLPHPTQRVAVTMAEIEQKQSGDEGRAREWMSRALRAPRDPAWVADGMVSDRWMPVSPSSGRLDGFEWKVPLAELVDERDVIDAKDSAAPPALPSNDEVEVPAPASAAPPPRLAAGMPASRAVTSPQAEPVIPLVHAPDDPGPEPGPDLEPEPEPGTSNESRGLRLFK